MYLFDNFWPHLVLFLKPGTDQFVFLFLDGPWEVGENCCTISKNGKGTPKALPNFFEAIFSF